MSGRKEGCCPREDKTVGKEARNFRKQARFNPRVDNQLSHLEKNNLVFFPAVLTSCPCLVSQSALRQNFTFCHILFHGSSFHAMSADVNRAPSAPSRGAVPARHC